MTETRTKYGSGRKWAGTRDPDDLLTPSAVAALKDCSKATVHLAIERGDLEGIPVLGPDGEPSAYAIRRAAAVAWTPKPVGWPAGKPRGSKRRGPPRLAGPRSA